MIPAHIPPNSFAFTALLGALAALPVLSIDLSAPTLPLLPGALGTTTLGAGLTLALFMVGFAIGQLAGGHLSDRHGRRPVLLSGLAGFTIAGALCAIAQTGLQLVAARMIQGLGAGACSVLSFAIVQDLFKGEAGRSKRAYVTVVFGAVPIFAPALGSLVIEISSWRAVHSILALGGAALAAVAWAGVAESKPKSLPDHSTIATNVSVRADTPVRLWRDRAFWGLTFANGLSYGCIFGYIAGAPVVIMGELGLSSATFAALFACTAASLTAGAWTGGAIGRRGIGAAALVDPSLAVSGVATIALAMSSVVRIKSPLVLIPLLLVILFARGIIAPNLQHMAIERRQHQAGAASAAVGFTQLLLAAMTSAVVALLLPRLGPAAVAIPMAVCATGGLATWRATITWARTPKQHLASRTAG